MIHCAHVTQVPTALSLCLFLVWGTNKSAPFLLLLTRYASRWVNVERSGFSSTKPLPFWHHSSVLLSLVSQVCVQHVHCRGRRAKVQFRELDCGDGCSERRRTDRLVGCSGHGQGSLSWGIELQVAMHVVAADSR